MDRLTARLSSHVLSIGLPFLYFLTSIAFYLHTYDSAQVKITLVQMLGTVLVGFWYVTLLARTDIQWKKYAPVAVPLLISLASGLISFSHAAYPGPSLDECLRRVFYIHFALIAVTEINSLERVKRLTTFLLLATAIATVYGMLQHFDYRFAPAGSSASPLDPFVWRQAFSRRAFSTFGNPNFFGNFLVIITPINLALLLKRNSEQPGKLLGFAAVTVAVSAFLWQDQAILDLMRMGDWANVVFGVGFFAFLLWALNRYGFLGGLFFLITLCNMITESKGAWIGFAAGFIAFLMLVLFCFPMFRSDALKRTIQRAAVITLVLCVLGVTVYSRQRSDSLRFRICTWVSTFEMGLMHPIIGNGIGSFRILYPAFRRPQIFHIEGKHNTETDHAEDEYWEVFQDEGLIGMGIFLWVILTFSMIGVRGLRRFTENQASKDIDSGRRKITMDPRAFYMLGFLAAFWGMLMHNFMDVSLRFVSSGIFLWLLAGMIGALVVHDPMPETDEARHALEPLEDPSADKKQALAAVPWSRAEHPMPVRVAGMAAIAVVFGYFTFNVFTQFSDAQGGVPDPFGDALLWLIAWAAWLATVGGSWWGLWRVVRPMKQVYGMIILCAMVPVLDVFWGYFMADVYHNRGIAYSKQQDWKTALDNYHRVVSLNPNYIMAYYFMGNVYTDRWQPGDFEAAIQQYQNVWRIAPNYVQSHHQAGIVYSRKAADDKKIADQLKAEGKTAEALQALQQTKLDWEKALELFHKYHGLDPVFEPNYSRAGTAHLQLADIAHNLGHDEEAQQHFEAAEAAYQESLHAVECGAPYNDCLHENWKATHRHHTAEMFENLANERYFRGRLVDAVRAYNLSLWQGPNNVRILKNLATIYARLGEQQKAIQTWLHIRELAPQDADAQRVFHGK